MAINAAPNHGNVFSLKFRPWRIPLDLQILFFPRDQNNNAKSRRPVITDQKKSSLSTSIKLPVCPTDAGREKQTIDILVSRTKQFEHFNAIKLMQSNTLHYNSYEQILSLHGNNFQWTEKKKMSMIEYWMCRWRDIFTIGSNTFIFITRRCWTITSWSTTERCSTMMSIIWVMFRRKIRWRKCCIDIEQIADFWLNNILINCS